MDVNKVLYPYLKIDEFNGELGLLRRFYDIPAHIRKPAEDTLFEMWNVTENGEEESYDDMTLESNRLREEGNRLFKAKLGRRDVLGACRLYTRAIFAAPEDSGSLALAHANRAMALLEFGYFRQSYDDCVCALELGYPEHLREKVVARQATCALHLGEVAHVRRHLADLEDMPPKQSVLNYLRELREKLAEFLRQRKDENPVGGQKDEEKLALQKRQKIVQSPGPAGRFMVATHAIGKHELIFSERVASFVPTNGHILCHECATKEIIPFPCKRCRCRVVYCSTKCRAAHAQVHAFECAGYRLQLIGEFLSYEHLGFRMMLDGLPQVVPHLRGKRNAHAMWAALVGKDKSSIAANDAVAYAQTLRLVQHLDIMDKKELLYYIIQVDILLLYLKKKTDFFKITEGTAATRRDWELITGALILRHIGQAAASSYFYSSLVLNGCRESLLLCDNLWKGPLSIQCGRLHQLSTYKQIAIAIFPYSSMGNHACEPSLTFRFSGRNMHAFALNEVLAGAEITQCYNDNYFNSKQQSRREYLKAIFNFECECAKCEKANPDADYRKMHRYRCENVKCHQIFVPHMPQQKTLNWWKNYKTAGEKTPIKCTVCGVEQAFKWFAEIENLLREVRKPTSRRLLYRQFEELDNWLIGQHELKNLLAINVLEFCFAAYDVGDSYLSDAEFTKLAQITKFVMSFLGTFYCEFTTEYVAKMTFLWDLIALRKYRCTRDELKPMLRAIDHLSDEEQTIFMNYYTDYIEPLLLQP